MSCFSSLLTQIWEDHNELHLEKQIPQTEGTPTPHCTLSAWPLLGLHFTGVTSAVSEEEIRLCSDSPLLPLYIVFVKPS